MSRALLTPLLVLPLLTTLVFLLFHLEPGNELLQDTASTGHAGMRFNNF
ncbi:MAG TPA: hypothetical protein VK826_16820 [Bacteroidia bacterium]|nr:hypothetical protein [Bacteroidia bacterium]